MSDADRAYALLHVKALDDEARTFTGVASTPELDRQGHTIDLAGIEFTNPVVLLFHHDRTQPIGSARLAKHAEAITFEATIAAVAAAGKLRERVDEAWQSVKAGLIRGVSIGFRAFEDGVKFLKDGTIHFERIEILELSLVTIPANARASIHTVKSFAASRGGVRTMEPKTIAEQITAAENTRAAKAARMAEIMSKAAGDNATLDEAQSKEYDDLELAVKALDTHMTRLRNMEALQIRQATPIAPAATATPQAASEARGGMVVSVKSNLPKGTAFVRAACAMLVCKGNFNEAAEYARGRWHDTTPEVETYLKAAVAAGNTTDATWAGPLVNQGIAQDFLELLRPATILGKIPGLRQVPFNTKVPSQTAGGTYGWVGENKPKPVTSLAFSAETLAITKAAGIIVLTEELVRLSNPSAEQLARNDMIAGIARFLDQQFIDPAVAAVAGVNPASITNGAPTAAASTNPMADILALISHFATNNIPVSGVTIIMSEVNALSLSFQTNADGSAKFPGMGIAGGEYKGINFVTSQAAGGLVIGLQPNLILFADDGGVTIDASREASLQMDSAPMVPDATTVYVNLWQNNLVGLRAERFVHWKRANANAVKYLTAAAYPAPTGTAEVATTTTAAPKRAA